MESAVLKIITEKPSNNPPTIYNPYRQYKLDAIKQFIENPNKLRGRSAEKWKGITIHKDTGILFKNQKPIIPFEHNVDVIATVWKDPLYGYKGRDRLYGTIKDLFVGVSKTAVIDFLHGNETTQKHHAYNPIKVSKAIIANRPFSRWHADLIDLSSIAGSNSRKKYALTVIDAFSKYAWVKPLANKEMATVVAAMESILKGSPECPSILQTDNGSEFQSDFTAMLGRYKVKQIYSSSHMPQSNAQIERFNKTLKTALNQYMSENKTKNWVDVVDSFVENYNNTIHTTTKQKPIDIHKDSKDKKSLDKKNMAADNIKEKGMANITRNKRLFPAVEIGDWVRISLFTLAEIRSKKYYKRTKQLWSDQVFKVIYKSAPAADRDPNSFNETYQIADLDGKKIPHKYIRSQILKVPESTANKAKSAVKYEDQRATLEKELEIEDAPEEKTAEKEEKKEEKEEEPQQQRRSSRNKKQVERPGFVNK